MAGLRFRDKRVETVKDGRKYFDLNNKRVGIDKREGICVNLGKKGGVD